MKLLFFRQSFKGPKGIIPIERIRDSFRKEGVDFEKHAVVLEHLPVEEFNTLLRRAFLYLDTPSFSGYTTAWQGIHAGIPIITLEGRFLRQRLASGLLRLAGITDTVVKTKEEYIEKVGELLKEFLYDHDRYRKRREAIRNASVRVTNDIRVVRAFERVILEELSLRGHKRAKELLNLHKEIYPEYEYRREQNRVLAPEREEERNSEREGKRKLVSASNISQRSEKMIPLWRLLEGDLHMHTLSQTYAPVGLLEMINRAPQKVLDIGCFVGATGKWLKERFPQVYVVGVEPIERAAKKAREIYDEVYNTTFEEVDIEGWRRYFDGVVAADVLEHMKNPWLALERIREILSDEGYLYVSLPNIRNLRIINMLAKEGEWIYEGAGILDITHLRFFTRKSAERMFNETGFQILERRANIDPALIQFIQGKDLGQIRNIELENLSIRGLKEGEALEFFVLQWFFKLKPVRRT